MLMQCRHSVPYQHHGMPLVSSLRRRRLRAGLTLRRMQDGKQVDVLDQMYWGDRKPSAPNDWCDADCQADPNRAAMLSLQLQDLAPNDARALFDPADWAAGEATAKGKGGGVEYVDGASATRLLGKKEYEQARNTQLAIGPLKILGNIRVVVTDRKMSDIVAALPVDFEAEVVVMRDYYPFGMEQPGQQYVASEYRYGFNGMERDDEVKGRGDSYDFGARMYDPRVGRWWSRDALEKKYPSMSPFASMANSPTRIVDGDGRDIFLFDSKNKLLMVLKVDGVDIGYRLQGISKEAMGVAMVIDPLNFGSMSESDRAEWRSSLASEFIGSPFGGDGPFLTGHDAYGCGLGVNVTLSLGLSCGWEIVYFPGVDEWGIYNYHGPSLGLMLGGGAYGIMGDKRGNGPANAASFAGYFHAYNASAGLYSLSHFWSTQGESQHSEDALFTEWNPNGNGADWNGMLFGAGPSKIEFGLTKTHTWFTQVNTSSSKVDGEELQSLKKENEGIPIRNESGKIENFCDDEG